ncbi:uncharacterized protein LOC133839325 isoform X2 [Drosophila sulfurigaster albostrigata]|uniref:uncharacterized protein LOC133839325 isoform X2 n=2 Tax=Drosophila sulfurigaster albostrigata TaxID=89887 RepID=UPI002D21B58F|nr:uncharacterized protein LOC133839325 isoform X2 [Drosophila sulfurigaster albostrigata]
MCSSSSKKKASKTMFPNYCFKKQSDDFGYEVLYVPKKNYSPSARQSNRPMNDSNVGARSRAQPQVCSKLCYEDLLRLQALREQNESAGPKPHVEFRLPPMDKQRQFAHRSNGGSTLNERERYLKEEEEEVESPPCASDPARDIQDSCADFFNIVYENVLEAVNVAVEQTVDKHFEELLSKVNQLKSEMSEQENMLKQLNTDLSTKISELSDTSLNQFKFIAQMLIDSQTIHYRAMNQQRLLKQQKKDEQDAQTRSISSDRSQHTANAYCHCHVSSVKSMQQQQQQQQMPRQQHQLWQQQDLNPFDYIQVPCTNCHRVYPKQDRPVLRRTRKGTASMPNLHQASTATSASSNTNSNKMKHTKHSSTSSNWSQFGTRRVANINTPPASSTLKKCRCHYHSPAPTQGINYVLSNNSSLGRKLRTLGKTLPSREDERTHS